MAAEELKRWMQIVLLKKWLVNLALEPTHLRHFHIALMHDWMNKFHGEKFLRMDKAANINRCESELMPGG